MKTKNNVQKAVLRSGAVVISFLLITFTVSANGFWKHLLTHNSFNQIAQALVVNSVEKPLPAARPVTTGHYADFPVAATDSRLALEPWMTNVSNFTKTSAPQVEQAADQALRLESWMLEESNFEFKNAADKPLKLEGWMTDYSFWSGKNL